MRLCHKRWHNLFQFIWQNNILLHFPLIQNHKYPLRSFSLLSPFISPSPSITSHPNLLYHITLRNPSLRNPSYFIRKISSVPVVSNKFMHFVFRWQSSFLSKEYYQQKACSETGHYKKADKNNSSSSERISTKGK